MAHTGHDQARRGRGSEAGTFALIRRTGREPGVSGTGESGILMRGTEEEREAVLSDKVCGCRGRPAANGIWTDSAEGI